MSELSDEKKKSGQADVVNRLLAGMEKRLVEADLKLTLADYIRLVQLKKEMDGDEPREIRVTWVDRESESSREK